MINTFNSEGSERYVVKHATNYEQFIVASFDTIEDAKKFAENEVKDEVPYNHEWTDYSSYFWFEIYDSFVSDWENNLDESSIYTTNDYLNHE